MLADDFEAIISFEDMAVDEYLRTYSVFTARIKLLPTNVIKRRSNVSHIQLQTMRDMNKMTKDKKRRVLID